MRYALAQAEKAYEAGEVPIGAVVVSENRIIGRGYNQREGLNDPTAHAEIIAITAAANTLGDWRLSDCLLYDYTKIAARLKKPASNYNLIFSYSAAPKYQNQVKAALKTNAPIAAVFRGGLPKTFLGREVIDGDKSDLVNIKAFNKIVGLKLKGGKSIQSIKSPFVIDVVNGVAI